MKFVRTLYRELGNGGDALKALAVKTFTEFRTTYHSIAQKMIARDLGVEGGVDTSVKVGVIMGSDRYGSASASLLLYK